MSAPTIRLGVRATTVAVVLAALTAAVGLTSLVMLAAGDSPAAVWQQMLSPPTARNLVNVVNVASVYYLSAVAVAIAFRMNLFNIGVDGQYRVAAFAAAYVGGEALLPGRLNLVLTIVVALAAGGAWAGLAAVLRVRRGVSEVISTIMLNAIATGLVAYLLSTVAPNDTGSSNVQTRELPPGTWIAGFSVPGATTQVNGFIVITVAVGLVYWFVLNRTWFGFHLRTAGESPGTAAFGGVNVDRLTLKVLVLSGCAAGLVGLPIILGVSHSYGTTFQPGLGFAGIAVALVGRNHPAGIAVAALGFAYIEERANLLQIVADLSPQVVAITQGMLVLGAVVAYRFVERIQAAASERSARAALES